MGQYTVHTYVTMRIPVTLEASSPRAAALLGREAALNIARSSPAVRCTSFGVMEYAEDYESSVIVDKLDSKTGECVRSWEIDPTP